MNIQDRMKPGPIVVIGSINMDLVATTRHLPKPGETVLGGPLATFPGGKGANQSVAAARLGAKVCHIGRVGDDVFADRMVASLAEAGVDTSHVLRTQGCASGTAMILVGGDGQNSILVSPGANAKVTPKDLEASADLIRSAAIILLQHELPLETVVAAARMARTLGIPFILDPAPALQEPLPAELWTADILSPNETEAEALLAGDGGKAVEPESIAARLIAKGARNVVLKLGERGSLVCEAGKKASLVPAFKVKAVDTTAAGDAFTGALAVALTQGRSMTEAARFANAVASISVTRAGAQASMPSRGEVDALLERA